MSTLTPHRWQQIEAAFLEILDADASHRTQLLAALNEADSELYREVVAMLTAHEDDPPNSVERKLLIEYGHGDDPMIGRTIGPYEVKRVIGRGGMGRVYLAERADHEYRSEVAIKVLPAEGADTERVKRFRVERQLLASLQHKHIATLLDGGLTTSGVPYLVMEYVDGVPVTEYCDRARLSIADRVRLFCQICDAVQYAHSHFVVHRDLKPSNILVNANGEAKLLDFGIAKMLDPAALGVTTPLIKTRAQMMTPLYAAPEQIEGRAITTATDVYAMGLLLYQLLVGRLPWFDEPEPHPDLARKIFDATPESLSRWLRSGRGDLSDLENVAEVRSTSLARLKRTLKGDLNTVVQMALRKEPERRYSSAGQLGEDLNRWLDGQPVIAHPDSLAYRLRRFVARNTLAVSGAALMATMVLAFAFYAAEQARQLRTERDALALEQARSNAAVSSLLDLFRTAIPNEARGDTVPIVPFLEQIEAEAESHTDQPELQARLLFTLGEIYAVRGVSGRAREFFSRAWELEQALGNADTVHARAVFHSLALQDHNMGNMDLATARFRESVAWHVKYFGEDHPDVAQALTDLAKTLTPEEAIPVLERASAIHRRLSTEDSTQAASTLNALGLVYSQSGNRSEALRTFQDVQSILERTLQPEHPYRLIVEHYVVSHQSDMSQRQKTLELLIPRATRVFGESSRRIAAMRLSLAEAYAALGKPTRAMAEFKSAKAIAEGTVGENSRLTARAAKGMSELHMLAGDYEQAVALLEDSPQNLVGWRDKADALSLRGIALLRLGQTTRAKTSSREAITLLPGTISAAPADWLPALVRSRFGILLLALREYDSAIVHLQSSLAALQASEEAPDSAIANCSWSLGRALLATGRRDEGVALLHSAIERYQSEPRVDPVELELAARALVQAGSP